MKKILLTLALLAGASSAHAKIETKTAEKRMPASESFMTEMNSDAASILSTVHESCPDKLAEAMKGANVISEVFKGEQKLEKQYRLVWQINTVQRYPAPSFQQAPVAALIIEWISEVREPGAPIAADQPPTWTKKCYIKKAK